MLRARFVHLIMCLVRESDPDRRRHKRTCYPLHYPSSQLPVARQPLTAVTEAAPLRSECLLNPDTRQRGVDAYAKSVGNAQRLQLSATAPHHREVVSRGGHGAFVRASDGCADAEASLAWPYRADARRAPSAPYSVGAGPTSWTAIPTWQLPDGHAPPPKQSSPANRRPPRMGVRWPTPVIPTGKPLRVAIPSHHHHHHHHPRRYAGTLG